MGPHEKGLDGFSDAVTRFELFLDGTAEYQCTIVNLPWGKPLTPLKGVEIR